MVIVVMGEVESGGESVGKLLAESLGWEFADVGSLACATQAQSPLTDAERVPHIEALSAVIDSSAREWRDLIVSGPTLTEKDRRQLCYKYPLVKFVYLRTPDQTHHSLCSDQPADFTKFGIAVRRWAALENDDRVLALDSSQGVEKILGAVLSALILKPTSLNVRVA